MTTPMPLSPTEARRMVRRVNAATQSSAPYYLMQWGAESRQRVTRASYQHRLRTMSFRLLNYTGRATYATAALDMHGITWTIAP